MKKIIIALLSIIIVLSMSACLVDPNNPTTTIELTATSTPANTTEAATPTDSPSPTPTNTPTNEPSPTPTFEPTATPIIVSPTDVLTSGTNIYAFGGGQGTINFDLNGDGTDDIITYSFLGYAGPVPADTINLTTPFLNMMDYDIYQCNIEVNGQPIIVQGEVMAGLILIGDIDITDSQYEIMIPEFGPSGDPQTTFITYNGIAPLNIGKLYQNPLMDLKVDGSKWITGQKRGTKLHTWFYDAKYRLENGLINEVKEDGLVLMNTAVTANVDLPLQMSPNDSTAAFTLSAGESATITWTDDEKWFCVEASSGLKGWFEITDFFTINGMAAPAVFDGLSMAD